jgi:hypothetical protein
MNLHKSLTSRRKKKEYNKLNSTSSFAAPNIIFDCSDLRNDIGLMVTKNIDDNAFQLHLYDGYNDTALVMNIDIQDFAKMFDIL